MIRRFENNCTDIYVGLGKTYISSSVQIFIGKTFINCPSASIPIVRYVQIGTFTEPNTSK